MIIAFALRDPGTLAMLLAPPDPIELLMERLRAAPTREWDLNQAGRMLAMSPATLKRRLAAHNSSFSAVLRGVRLDEGQRRVIDENRSVFEAALDAGYRSPSKFAAAFRRRFGHNPAAARRRKDA